MPHELLDTAPASRYTVFVKFEWGVANVARYVRYDTDIVVGGETYLSAMDIDVKPGVIDGQVEDKPWTLTMRSRQPLTNMVRPLVQHAPVTVTISERDPGNTASAPRVMFKGVISTSYRNKDNNPNLVGADISGPKSRLQYALGLPCSDLCVWPFGDPHTCGKDLTPLKQYVTITAVNGLYIAAPTLTLPRPHYWTRGWVEVDGLRIEIVDSSLGGVSALQLQAHPPPEWLNAVGTFTPGCLHTPRACDEDWDNIINYGGIGIAMLDYDPLMGSKR